MWFRRVRETKSSEIESETWLTFDGDRTAITRQSQDLVDFVQCFIGTSFANPNGDEHGQSHVRKVLLCFNVR